MEHNDDCPRMQFWDAGEDECGCTCYEQDVISSGDYEQQVKDGIIHDGNMTIKVVPDPEEPFYANSADRADWLSGHPMPELFQEVSEIPLHYVCLIHGETSAVLTFTLEGEEGSMNYCIHCMRDLIAPHLPTLEQVETDDGD